MGGGGGSQTKIWGGGIINAKIFKTHPTLTKDLGNQLLPGDAPNAEHATDGMLQLKVAVAKGSV